MRGRRFKQGCRVYRFPVGVEAALRCLEYRQDPKPLAAVGARRAAVDTAIDEVLTFVPERLRLGGHDGFALRVARSGDLAIGPGDVLAVDEQLFLPRFGVVEDRQPRRADHRHLLLLERIEPTDEDVGANAAGKAHRRQGGVGHIPVEIVSSGAANLLRQLTSREGENDGNVVGRKAPQRVFLPTRIFPRFNRFEVM